MYIVEMKRVAASEKHREQPTVYHLKEPLGGATAHVEANVVPIRRFIYGNARHLLRYDVPRTRFGYVDLRLAQDFNSRHLEQKFSVNENFRFLIGEVAVPFCLCICEVTF